MGRATMSIIIKAVSRAYQACKFQIAFSAQLVDRCIYHLARIEQGAHSPLSFPRATPSVGQLRNRKGSRSVSDRHRILRTIAMGIITYL